jgi:hypothetical protein
LDARSDAATETRPVWPLNGSAPARRLASAVEHRNLSSLLLVHDVLCHEGVAKASRLLSQSAIAEGVDACIYFNLHDLAAAMSEIPLAAATPLSARVFDDEYHRRYATSEVVVDAILRHMAARSYESPRRPANDR